MINTCDKEIDTQEPIENISISDVEENKRDQKESKDDETLSGDNDSEIYLSK